MKSDEFTSTPEFQHFREVMRGILRVPKKRLDELVEEARETSPRKDNPNAPGQKQRKRLPVKKKPR